MVFGWSGRLGPPEAKAGLEQVRPARLAGGEHDRRPAPARGLITRAGAAGGACRRARSRGDGAQPVWCIDFKGWFRTGDGSAAIP